MATVQYLSSVSVECVRVDGVPRSSTPTGSRFALAFVLRGTFNTVDLLNRISNKKIQNSVPLVISPKTRNIIASDCIGSDIEIKSNSWFECWAVSGRVGIGDFVFRSKFGFLMFKAYPIDFYPNPQVYEVICFGKFSLHAYLFTWCKEKFLARGRMCFECSHYPWTLWQLPPGCCRN